LLPEGESFRVPSDFIGRPVGRCLSRNPCPLCGCTKIIEAMPVIVVAMPRILATQGRLAVTQEGEGGDASPLGLLQILVCRSCGHTQWFAAAPESIVQADDPEGGVARLYWDEDQPPPTGVKGVHFGAIVTPTCAK